ncbi:hypothetical protein C7974DRAFT_1141 [Boeremia exigua]|uniref:uncharacterized protein n=1 Tax=Boeremia exigua TaxID=749465 RepID=UPI001E8E48B3|nr:uncharacterized protein C7974DRAFT_1141 [Boeremia exigua]KAH6643595.1 hypothetical protein C7974DRAFT_1141 [Boeremia exigua]
MNTHGAQHSVEYAWSRRFCSGLYCVVGDAERGTLPQSHRSMLAGGCSRENAQRSDSKILHCVPGVQPQLRPVDPHATWPNGDWLNVGWLNGDWLNSDSLEHRWPVLRESIWKPCANYHRYRKQQHNTKSSVKAVSSHITKLRPKDGWCLSSCTASAAKSKPPISRRQLVGSPFLDVTNHGPIASRLCWRSPEHLYTSACSQSDSRLHNPRATHS